MIQFNNITKKFRHNFWDKEFIAVDNVSFRIETGDLVGFLGANGAGKTTLIKILMDFSRQTSGQVSFDKIMGQNSNEIKSSIGYLPERPYLYPHLTGREFLLYVGNLNSIASEKLETLIIFWSEKMQIDQALEKATKEYSKGMLQRLVLFIIQNFLFSMNHYLVSIPWEGAILRISWSSLIKAESLFFSAAILFPMLKKFVIKLFSLKKENLFTKEI